MKIDKQLTPEEQARLLALLEDLVEDYDEIGFPNVCTDFAPFDESQEARDSDSRCCWVRRSYARLFAWREEHLGNAYGRVTARVGE